tara:strand:+ start:61 stop:342 length:282 start_codon:yes stop_codon:yes gene_type:complete
MTNNKKTDETRFSKKYILHMEEKVILLMKKYKLSEHDLIKEYFNRYELIDKDEKYNYSNYLSTSSKLELIDLIISDASFDASGLEKSYDEKQC